MEIDMHGSSLELPTAHYLERDPDILVLRRRDGSLVGTFSARGAVHEAVRQTAEKTANPGSSGRLREEADWRYIRARFFGHFELLCDDETISLGRSSKSLTILKYLLANRSRPISQDHLMGWLWPESNLKKARWSLNSAVHGLRKVLGSCPSSSDVNYVLLEEGYYRLSPSVRVTTDVEEFDAHYERGRRLEKVRGLEEAATEYEAAVEVDRGEYLVENLYEDWTMVERERLANAYVDMLDRLAAHYIETRQLRECIRACYQVLEKDRCHEDTYRLLMRCCARLGMRNMALRQYRLYEKILEQEYGTAPSPETRSLYKSLLKDESN